MSTLYTILQLRIYLKHYINFEKTLSTLNPSWSGQNFFGADREFFQSEKTLPDLKKLWDSAIHTDASRMNLKDSEFFQTWKNSTNFEKTLLTLKKLFASWIHPEVSWMILNEPEFFQNWKNSTKFEKTLCIAKRSELI